MDFKINENLIPYKDGYIGIAKKQRVKLNTYYYESDNHIPVYKFTYNTLPEEYYLNPVIFATANLNLNDVPVLDIREVTLAIDEIYGKDENLYSMIHDRVTFSIGYNKAKETYKYTEKDVLKAIDLARRIDLDYFIKNGHHNYLYDPKEIIKQLSKLKQINSVKVEMICGRCRKPDSDEEECWSAKECSRGCDFEDEIRIINKNGKKFVVVTRIEYAKES